jgi:hypothetical protein
MRPQEEVEEVEQKLSAAEAAATTNWQRLLLTVLTPVFLEALVLTFLAEWGDRSQIATITLATQYNPYGAGAAPPRRARGLARAVAGGRAASADARAAACAAQA